MRVTYYGQACTLIEAGGKKILTDPWLTEGAYSGTWFHTHILADAGVTPQSVPKDIDYLFISHEHLDHMDPATLSQFPVNIPILICKFSTPKFRSYLQSLGFTNIRECPSGETLQLGNGVTAIIFGTAEYTNDSAILVEHEGVRVFNETDCKLAFDDLKRVGELGIDVGFYMFSGANWYPMLYDYPDDKKRDLVQRRRKSLLRSLVQRVKLTKPRFAVPAAGPCTVLDPQLLYLNSEEDGIFVDPVLAVEALSAAQLPSKGLYMAATDYWDSNTGYQSNAPASFRIPRTEYIRQASARLAPSIAAARAAEPAAGADLPQLLTNHFQTMVAAQTQAVRDRINAKLLFIISGPQGGEWTVDFKTTGTTYVQPGAADDWNYRIEVEDKLIYPFLNGTEPFFEDLLLSLRFKASRRPDEYNEPLYHFLYEPDPKKLHDWYAAH